jgi:hypothetical protein
LPEIDFDFIFFYPGNYSPSWGPTRMKSDDWPTLAATDQQAARLFQIELIMNSGDKQAAHDKL